MNTITLTLNGALATVSLNRPALHNAFNPEMIAELNTAFAVFGADAGVRVIVLTGEGRSFCAGADVEWMRSMADFDETANVADALVLAGLFAAIQSCPKPVIARVQGAALGGGSGLVAAADCVIAAEDAVFGFTEATLGIMPAVISPFVLGKIVPGAARELFLTGERFGAARGREIGLVQHVVPMAELDSALAGRVELFLGAAPGAQSAIKDLLPRVQFRSPADVRELTARAIAARRVSAEGQEGLRSFLEKRKPSWRA